MTRQIAFGYGAPSPAGLELRIHELEEQVALLTEATKLLARALAGSPLAEPGDVTIAEAARRAHELVIASGFHATGTGTNSAER